MVVKAFSALVPSLDVFAGASIESDGSVLLVLDPPGLIERSRRDGRRSFDDLDATTAEPAQGPGACSWSTTP